VTEERGELVQRGHLGGYVAGGDPATWFPDLWDWLVRWEGVESVLDVGCGDGQALGYFRKLGCDVLGIDGVPQPDPDILQHDYEDGPLELGDLVPAGHFDLCWCCEFVEHVEERYIPNFLATFRAARLLLMTHAEPGQAGYHHVNCRDSGYWIRTLEGDGWEFDGVLTKAARELASFNRDPWNHFARSGLAFRR
jgi:SAM-dependent methyltransferase